MASYHTNSVNTIPPDDLPNDRLADALALRRFMRQWHLPTFVVGSQSAAAALDLARVGMIRLQREYGIGGVELLTVVQP